MRPISHYLAAALAVLTIFPALTRAEDPAPAPAAKTETAVFGMGCFWCGEALYERFKGVSTVVSGYAGGHTDNPNYEEVSDEKTGHAEVFQITYDPAVISYERLLEIFFDVHNPTTKNRQDNDIGTRYRSIILTANEEQAKLAKAAVVAAQEKYKNPIVTEIAPLKQFYAAEEYHQDYFAKHPNEPYCAYMISPKLQKLEKSKGPELKPKS